MKSTAPQAQALQTTEPAYWKKIFLVCSVLLLIIMPLLSRYYGQSGDEWLQIEYGQHIWNYFFKGDKQALDYTNMSLQYEGMNYYGGLYDFSMELVHRMVPAIPILILRHFFNAICGALLMIFTGLFAFRLSRRWSVGLIALLFIAFSPRIFGESMNNPKDIPFAMGFIIGMYYFWALLQDLPARIGKNAAGIGLGFLFAFGVRPAGGLLLLACFVVMTGLFYFTYPGFRESVKANGRLVKKSMLFVGIALIAAYILSLLAWPYGLQDPITHPFASLQKMANRGVTIRVFFEGIYLPNDHMPWYYVFKWILISNPVIVILGAALFIILVNAGRKEYGTTAVALLLFTFFFPPLYMIYKKSAIYDTWRHLFFIYPYFVCMGALGLNLIGRFVNSTKLVWLPVLVAVLGLTPAIAWTVRSHPNQYVYFNEFVGGVEGAYGYYDTDYYQNSGLQDADWVLAHVKKIPGRKVRIASNMLGFDKYFAKDTSWIDWHYVRYGERNQSDWRWDYYITYSRFVSPDMLQNGKWPPQNVVYAAKVGDVPLSVVIQRKSEAAVTAYAALQKSDFATAIRDYQEYLKTDTSDEGVWLNYGIALASAGQMDAAISAIGKATQIDPGQAQFYSVLAQVYKAKGDMQNAQNAQNMANSIMMKEQEFLQ